MLDEYNVCMYSLNYIEYVKGLSAVKTKQKKNN